MPPHRHVRQRTGNHRKRPIRDCQEQYRWKRGLDVLDVALQSALQTQVLYCTNLSKDITAQSAALIAEGEMLLNPVERDELFDQADTLLLMHQHVIQPISLFFPNKRQSLPTSP